jgi:hypothetical protein
MAHCFLYCPVVEVFLNTTCSLIGFQIRVNADFEKLFWYGIKREDDPPAKHMIEHLIIFDVYRYLVFRYRLRKTMPSYITFLDEYCHYIRWICRTNNKIKALLFNSFPNTILLQAIG